MMEVAPVLKPCNRVNHGWGSKDIWGDQTTGSLSGAEETKLFGPLSTTHWGDQTIWLA